MDSVSTILATLDAAITAAGRQFFEATASAIGPIYTSLLALLLRGGADSVQGEPASALTTTG